MNAKSAVLTSIFGAILFLWAIGTASAGITVVGATIGASITPGQHFSYGITIENSADDNSSNITTEIYGVNQSQTGDYSSLTEKTDKYSYSARPFLRVSPANFTLEPGMSKKILVEADVPKDIGEGGRYAVVDIVCTPPSDSSRRINIGSNFQIPVKLTIEGSSLNKTGEIYSLNITDDPISARQQNISMTIKNTGNYHYRALAEADLVDEDGNILANDTSQMSFGNILPLAPRLFLLSLQPKSELVPGTYYIKARANREDGIVVAEKEIKFEIKP